MGLYKTDLFRDFELSNIYSLLSVPSALFQHVNKISFIFTSLHRKLVYLNISVIPE